MQTSLAKGYRVGDPLSNTTGMNADMHVAFETSMLKDCERCQGGERGGGREGMLLWNDINVQKWFHMHGRGPSPLDLALVGPDPGK